MCKKILLALVAVIIIYKTSGAQCLGSCCCAANVATTGQTASIPDKGGWIIGVNLLTMQYEPLSNETLMMDAKADTPVFSVKSQWTAKVSLAYGITSRLSAAVSLPYNYSSDNLEGHYHVTGVTEIHTYGSIRGAGDGTLLFNYQFINDEEKGWKAYAGAGIKVPTGKTDAPSTYDVVLPVHLQPGTGSWDPLLQATVAKTINRWMLQSQAFVKIATTALDHNMGDYYRLEANVSYECWKDKKIISSLNATGGLALDHNAKMKFAEGHDHGGGTVTSDSSGALIPFENSGFTRLMIQAKVLCILPGHFSVPLQVAAPLVQELGGTQAALQWTASAGINYSF